MILINYLAFVYLYINEKKNNMAWYQRTYFIVVKGLKNLILILNFRFFLFMLIILFSLKLFVFDQPTIHCFNSFLKTHLIGGHIVHFSGDIAYPVAFDIIKYIKYNQFGNLNYNIYTPTKLCINTFPHNHPYRHPHLNILQYNNLINDISINIQMSSHNFNNCSLLSDINIDGEDRHQHIANSFYFYKNDVIGEYLLNNNCINNKIYLDNHLNKINNHIFRVINKYKI